MAGPYVLCNIKPYPTGHICNINYKIVIFVKKKKTTFAHIKNRNRHNQMTDGR